MFDSFRSLPELFDYFKDEATCLAYWEQGRWGGNITCPHCGSADPYKTNRGYKCTNLTCQKKFSALVGSIFESTKIPLRTWFGAMYLCMSHKKGVSSLQISRDLGIPQKTAWFLLHRIRETFKELAPEILGANGETVEVDEAYVGGKLDNMHENKKKTKKENPHHNKTIIMGFAQRNGQVRTMVIPDTNVGTMRSVVIANVAPQARLISDSHRSYHNLYDTYDNHKMVKAVDGYKTGKLDHTNTIEGYWSHFKRTIIGVYHYISPKHLQAYCNETSFRYNTRKVSDPERFANAMKNCVARRLTYNRLVADA